jgi:hypothetical protein
MSLIEIDRNPSPDKLRWFGALLGALFAWLGAMAWWRLGAAQVAVALWFAGIVLVAAYYLAPAVQRPAYVGWMYAVHPLGLAISYVVLAFAYFLVIMPIGLVVRTLIGDPLERAFDRRAATYWTPHHPPASSERYFRQF